MSTKMSITSKRSLRLLSIDNGGIRGLSPLRILREILVRIQQQEGLPDIPRPCDIFDLAGGSGTGGIIVLMLFRLQMTIDAAIMAYKKLSERVFSEKKWFFQEGTFKATRLEEAVLSLIQQSGEGGDPKQVLFRNEEGPKCFVTAMCTYEGGTHGPIPFCSWRSTESNLDWFQRDCTIVEAVRATTAVPNFFKPARVRSVIRTTCFDIKVECNNPTKYVMEKAKGLYGDRPISYLLSLGTGQTYAIGATSPDAFRQWLPTRLLRTLQDVVMDCEQKSNEICYEFARRASRIHYVRFNDYDWRALAEWRAAGHTICYIKKFWQHGDVNKLLQLLKDAHHEIYRNELSKQGRGLPLWIPGPTPSLPQAYRQDGTKVGDVGIIRTDGSFDFLFNIFLPADHAINSEGVPYLFQPLLNRVVVEFPCDMPGTVIGSPPDLSVQGDASGLVFETSVSEGAILVLPQGSWRRTTRDKDGMREYMMLNIRAWYQYVARKRVLRNGDLVLVYQCDNAPSCGMASFSGGEGQAKTFTFNSMTRKKRQVMTPPFEWELTRGQSYTRMKQGPLAFEGENDLSGVVKNQCVFMRTLSARLSEEDWDELKPKFN